jgi:hypothetical protein
MILILNKYSMMPRWEALYLYCKLYGFSFIFVLLLFLYDSVIYSAPFSWKKTAFCTTKYGRFDEYVDE